MQDLKKYKIGYTAGVFDLFHIGHLNILRRSKELCEYLIVGVSTDEVVAKYKDRLPTINYADRAAIVEAIKYVDKVVPQKSMDKMLAWEDLKFDVMFHGDDWKGSPLYEKYKKEFEQIGVDLVFLPYTEGISSTDLKERLAEKQVVNK